MDARAAASAETLGERDRYARHSLIPGWEQVRLTAATAIVVGVGALGNEVAKNLALAGFGRLVLCDPDTVHVSNLSRTVLFGPHHTAADAAGGRPKAAAAAQALRAMVPGLDVESRVADLASGVGLGEMNDAAVVVGCLDSRHARLRLLGRCALAGTPLVDGGTTAWGGEVRVRLAVDEPCYGCSLTTHQRSTTDVPWSCTDAALMDGPLGASIATSALVAGWMAQAVLRIALGRPPGYRLLRIDGEFGHAAPVEVRRDPGCPHHGRLGAVQRLALDHTATVAELLAALPADADPLTWTEFRLPGDCGHCGAALETGSDLGAAARLCPVCGRRLRLPFTRRLREAPGQLSLRELAVAPEEIIAVLQPEGDVRWLRLDP